MSFSQYVSSRHRTFYLGMLMLEEDASHCESLTERMKEVAGPELPTRFAKQLVSLIIVDNLDLMLGLGSWKPPSLLDDCFSFVFFYSHQLV